MFIEGTCNEKGFRRMLIRFKKHIDENFPELLDNKIIVAVSGGVDSMVLLHLFAYLRLNFSAAHCNFQLRDEQSDLDEKLVQDYCKEHTMECFIRRFDTKKYMYENGMSVQIAARELRYNWFKKLIQERNIQFIATAHHLDDQVETFLINFTRGTGIDGLMGIPERNNHIVRPLLPFSREEILTYAHENSIQWREDASNASTKYFRNKIRHLIVPILKEENSHFLQSFQKTLRHLHHTQSLVQDALGSFKRECIKTDDKHIIIDLDKIKEFHSPINYLIEFLKEYGFDSLDEIEKIIRSVTGSILKNAKYTILKNRKELILMRNNNEANTEYYINSFDEFKNLPLNISISEVKKVDDKSDKNSIFVNSILLKWPLKLRKRKEGDFFHPFGMKGIKKISKFLKDEKLSLFEKEALWILENGDEKIIWIIGHRADNRFKIINNNQQTYKITLNQ